MSLVAYLSTFHILFLLTVWSYVIEKEVCLPKQNIAVIVIIGGIRKNIHAYHVFWEVKGY